MFWPSCSQMALDDLRDSRGDAIATQAQEETEMEQLLLRELFLKQFHWVSHRFWTQPASTD